jgi:hypothetical protein
MTGRTSSSGTPATPPALPAKGGEKRLVSEACDSVLAALQQCPARLLDGAGDIVRAVAAAVGSGHWQTLNAGLDGADMVRNVCEWRRSRSL